MSRCSFLVLAVAALCMPLRALSWGTEGHQVIASLAERKLTPHHPFKGVIYQRNDFAIQFFAIYILHS